MSKPIAIGDPKIVYKGRILQIVNQQMQEKERTFVYEWAERSPGVRVLIIKDNKVLLTKEHRSELGDFDYRLPGGKVVDKLEEYNTIREKEESILDHAIAAVKRECGEEAGIITKNITHYHTSHCGATMRWDLYYFIVDEFEESTQSLESGEVIEPVWKTFEEVKAMCLDGGIKEDRSVAVLLKFLLK